MTFKVLRSYEIFIRPLSFLSGSHDKTSQISRSMYYHLELSMCIEIVVLLSSRVQWHLLVTSHLIVHSVCVKSLHETNVQTSWSFESGNNSLFGRMKRAVS